jgi:hypothetical protein
MRGNTKKTMHRKSGKAEIIVKEGYFIDDSRSRGIAIPKLLLLANREGYQLLAEICVSMAKKRITDFLMRVDPDHHCHLDTVLGPFSRELSDQIEIRLGLLTPENRTAVFRNYSISRSTRRRGDLAERYRRMAIDSTHRIKRSAAAMARQVELERVAKKSRMTQVKRAGKSRALMRTSD